jgi:hypothetical protein
MIWTREKQPYGAEAFVDETRTGHWGGLDFPLGSISVCKGQVYIELQLGSVDVERYRVGEVTGDQANEIYSKARHEVEVFVIAELKRYDECRGGK